MIIPFQDQLSLIRLRGLERQVDRLLLRLNRHPGLSNLSISLKRDLKLALIEAITNAFHHGLGEKKSPVLVKFMATAKKIVVEIEDSGPGFSLSQALKQKPEELAPRGRGLWILKSLMDRVRYRRGKPNRLLFERKLTRSKNIEAALELLTQLQISLQRLKPLSQLYEELLDFVLDFFNAERASLLTFDTHAQQLKMAASRGLKKSLQHKITVAPGKEVSGYVFSTGRGLLIQDAAAFKRRGLKSRGKNYNSSSFMSVPVTVTPDHIGEEILGVLNLTDRRDGKKFTPFDLKLLQLMVTQAAGLFRLRSLMEQVRKKESWQREMQIVSEIQSRLLPQSFPKVSGVEIGGQYELSPQGGGDYYDVLEREGELWGVMADVSGHNVASALTMAGFRSLVRHSFSKVRSPAHWLQILRREMQNELEQTHHFISAWTFHLKPQGELILCGAGHPPLLHYQAKTKKWKEYQAKQLPLGLPDEIVPQNRRVHLNEGDWIFLYTDGLFDPHMRESGWDVVSFEYWFQQKLLQNSKISPQDLAEELFINLKERRLGLKHPDDVAVLAIKKN